VKLDIRLTCQDGLPVKGSRQWQLANASSLGKGYTLFCMGNNSPCSVVVRKERSRQEKSVSYDVVVGKEGRKKVREGWVGLYTFCGVNSPSFTHNMSYHRLLSKIISSSFAGATPIVFTTVILSREREEREETRKVTETSRHLQGLQNQRIDRNLEILNARLASIKSTLARKTSPSWTLVVHPGFYTLS